MQLQNDKKNGKFCKNQFIRRVILLVGLLGFSILRVSVLADDSSAGPHPGLKPIDDTEILSKILDEVIEKNPEALKQIKAGASKPVDFLMGQVMRRSKGKADPQKIRSIILAMTDNC